IYSPTAWQSMGKLREYLKLSRSFNAGLTAIAPVMGAVAMKEAELLPLLLLFTAGFFGHVYGFVLNDIIDLRIDKGAAEISDRPLVSGTVSLREAWTFALLSMVASFVIAVVLAWHWYTWFPIVFLALSALSITIYDLISKRYPAMDVFVGAGVLLLIVYGAASVGWPLSQLAWLVVGLGTLQVLFMQFIAGSLKDVENDYRSDANTLAVAMGVRVEQGRMTVPLSFQALAYGLQAVDLAMLFTPLVFIFGWRDSLIQLVLLVPLSIAMIVVSMRLLGMQEFDREQARQYIGLHYFINFSLVPIMLTAVNPWIGLLVFVPFGAFVLSNLTLHGTLLRPKTM
ncbi:MAG: UbiA family prenyltransferase, partial [Thermoplasmatota archaeon]